MIYYLLILIIVILIFIKNRSIENFYKFRNVNYPNHDDYLIPYFYSDYQYPQYFDVTKGPRYRFYY